MCFVQGFLIRNKLQNTPGDNATGVSGRFQVYCRFHEICEENCEFSPKVGGPHRPLAAPHGRVAQQFGGHTAHTGGTVRAQSLEIRHHGPLDSKIYLKTSAEIFLP